MRVCSLGISPAPHDAATSRVSVPQGLLHRAWPLLPPLKAFHAGLYISRLDVAVLAVDLHQRMPAPVDVVPRKLIGRPESSAERVKRLDCHDFRPFRKPSSATKHPAPTIVQAYACGLKAAWIAAPASP